MTHRRQIIKPVLCGLAITALFLSGTNLTAAGSSPAPAASTGLLAVASDGPLELTLREALLTALEHNPALRVQRWNPAIQKTYEAQPEAVFDPTVAAQLQKSKVYNSHAIQAPAAHF